MKIHDRPYYAHSANLPTPSPSVGLLVPESPSLTDASAGHPEASATPGVPKGAAPDPPAVVRQQNAWGLAGNVEPRSVEKRVYVKMVAGGGCALVGAAIATAAGETNRWVTGSFSAGSILAAYGSVHLLMMAIEHRCGRRDIKLAEAV